MRRIFVVTAVVAVLLMPVMAYAAPVEFPLVQCGGFDASGAEQKPCEPCDLYKAFGRVINLVLFGITAPIAAFMIVLSGGMMLLGGANANSFGKGKKMLFDTWMGVTVILLAWVATNFLIKSLGGGSGDATPWYEFECPKFLVDAPRPGLPSPAPSRGSAQNPAPELTEANRKLATDQAALAKAYKSNPNVTAVAPSLQTLVKCIENDPVVLAMVDFNKRFTYDKDHPACNLTRGHPVAGACSHSVNSCHYGGKTGTQGAMAVDYNSNGKSVRYEMATRKIVPLAPGEKDDRSKFRTAAGNDRGLFEEIVRSALRNNCAVGLLQYENTKGGPHTHISTTDCDSDSGGIKGRVED